jgi:hypothetical protein
VQNIVPLSGFFLADRLWFNANVLGMRHLGELDIDNADFQTGADF